MCAPTCTCTLRDCAVTSNLFKPAVHYRPHDEDIVQQRNLNYFAIAFSFVFDLCLPRVGILNVLGGFLGLTVCTIVFRFETKVCVALS